MTRVSRRGLLGGSAEVAGLAAGLGAGAWYGEHGSAASAAATSTTYAFRGEHQAGIVTPAQDRLHFAAFDITTGSRAQLVRLLKAWTAAADRMTRGLSAGPIGPTEGAPLAPPDDTGEAIGLGPAGLTLFVIAYVRDPRTSFLPMQERMAANDAMMEYLRFTSSAIFAVPPGAAAGEYVGQALFA